MEILLDRHHELAALDGKTRCEGHQLGQSAVLTEAVMPRTMKTSTAAVARCHNCSGVSRSVVMGAE